MSGSASTAASSHIVRDPLECDRSRKILYPPPDSRFKPAPSAGTGANTTDATGTVVLCRGDRAAGSARAAAGQRPVTELPGFADALSRDGDADTSGDRW
jgi:hypothetical protein